MNRPTRSRFALAFIGILLGMFLVTPSTAIADPDASAVQKFLLISTSVTDEGGPIAATGAIHAKGTDVVLGPRKDRFEFPDGNIILRHKPKSGGENFDPDTCLFTFTERGTWKVNEGTGDYADAKGSGKYRVTGQGFTCDPENNPPRPFYFKITAVGKLTF